MAWDWKSRIKWCSSCTAPAQWKQLPYFCLGLLLSCCLAVDHLMSAPSRASLPLVHAAVARHLLVLSQTVQTARWHRALSQASIFNTLLVTCRCRMCETFWVCFTGNQWNKCVQTVAADLDRWSKHTVGATVHQLDLMLDQNPVFRVSQRMMMTWDVVHIVRRPFTSPALQCHLLCRIVSYWIASNSHLIAQARTSLLIH